MAKVKEYTNWKRIIFNDREIIPADRKYYSSMEWERLLNLEVLKDKNGETLIVETR